MQLGLFGREEGAPAPDKRSTSVHVRLLRGVLARRMLEAYPELEGVFNAELDRVLRRNEDRDLFGLRRPFQLVLPFQLEFHFPEQMEGEGNRWSQPRH